MATTHAFAGIALAAVVAAFAPEFAVVIAGAALLGGVFPDFDLYIGHRKTLHYPVYYPLVALPAGTLALLAPATETVALATFLAAAGLHSISDALGGGLELRPWEGRSDRAVYSHYHGRWLAPQRWIRYDGAPEDLALAGLLATPGVLVFEGIVRDVLLVMLAISIGYTAVRKPMVHVTEWLIARAPASVLASLPVRFLPIDDEDAEYLFGRRGNADEIESETGT